MLHMTPWERGMLEQLARGVATKDIARRYDMDELAQLLRGYGFAARPALRNIGISRARKTMLAVKQP